MKKRRLIPIICLVGAGTAALMLIPFFIAGERDARLPSAAYTPAEPDGKAASPQVLLKVMTLNLAHGRGTGPNQALQGEAAIRSHLDEVAGMLLREKPAAVALQEADGPSLWSGNFNHVEYLAGKTGLPYSARGEHVKGLGLTYGSAILCRLRLNNVASVTFPPSPPAFPKGFVACTIEWPEGSGNRIDLASVHLDFMNRSARRTQAAELVGKLSPRTRPLILMGDFNSEWNDERSPLRILADGLDLKAFRPEAKEMETFPFTKRRMDWILISSELEFSSYAILPDTLSDHFAVAAEVKRTGP